MTNEEMSNIFRGIKDQINDETTRKLVETAFNIGFCKSRANDIDHELSMMEDDKKYGLEIDSENEERLKFRQRINDSEFKRAATRMTNLIEQPA